MWVSFVKSVDSLRRDAWSQSSASPKETNQEQISWQTLSIDLENLHGPASKTTRGIDTDGEFAWIKKTKQEKKHKKKIIRI